MIIYKTTNLINDKIYIGKDKHNNPNYLGSGKILKLAIAKYGIDNFLKEILEYCTDLDDMNSKEKYWISKLNSFAPTGYNIGIGGAFGDILTHHPNKKEICDKISKSLLGRSNGKRSITIKNKISKTLQGKKFSVERKNNIRLSLIGKPANNRKSIIINDITYNCAKHASDILRINVTTIRSRINNSSFVNYQYA